MPGTSSSRQKQSARSKRQAIHTSREEARSPDQKINQIDFDAITHPLKNQSTLHGYDVMREWFQEFHEDVLDEHDGDKYFQGPNSPSVTIALGRKFLYWLADSRTGLLPDPCQPIQPSGGDLKSSRITLVTLSGYCMILLGALRYHGCALEREVRQQISWYVNNDLRLAGVVSLERKEKPIAYGNDVSTILRCLFLPWVMSTYSTPRDVFSLALFINLAIDSCGRPGEILSTRTYPQQYLSWDDCQFWVHPGANGNTFTGILTFRWLKGKRLEPSEVKKISLRLLPTELAYEDTLRQLLIMAITDELIEGVQCWKDLEAIQPHASGSLLILKISSERPAILARPLVIGADVQPISYPWVASKLGYLGVVAGFRQRLTTYAFRRGIAYVLKTNASATDREFLMGHGVGSKVFAEYESSLSTIDFQSLARGLDAATDVHSLGGMSLGRREEAPKKLSQSGFDIVKSDPMLKKLEDSYVRAVDQCILQHRTIEGARKACGDAWACYTRATGAKASCFRSLAAKRFQQEYSEFMMQSVGAELPGVASSSISCSKSDTLVLGTSNDEEDCGMVEPIEYSDFEGIDRDDGVGVNGDDLAASMTSEFRDFLDLVATETEVAYAASTVDDLPSQGLHYHDVHKQSRREFGLARTAVSRYPLFADIYSRITGDALTNTEVSDLLVPFISTMHGLDTFPSSLLPSSGTLMCNFCGESHFDEARKNKNSICYVHYSCYSKSIGAEAQRLFDSIASGFPSTCSWGYLASNASLPNSTPPKFRCGKVFDPVGTEKHVAHLYNHIVQGGLNARLVCLFEPCYAETVFDNVQDCNAHMQSAHGYMPIGGPHSLYQWCSFCEDFVWEPNRSHGWAAHCESHMSEAVADIEKYGYGQVSIALRSISPGYCIFCIHDQCKIAYERLQMFRPTSGKSNVLKKHTARHFEALDQKSKHHCPASAESGTDIVFCGWSKSMTVDELLTHVKTVHNIDVDDLAGRCKGKRTENQIEKTEPLQPISNNKRSKSSSDKDSQE